jgi:hypothetical protein
MRAMRHSPCDSPAVEKRSILFGEETQGSIVT